MRVVEQSIQDFLVTLKMGLGWVADAGRKLVAMVDRDPHVFDDIMEVKTESWITREVLKTVEAVGRGQIAPELLILPHHVMMRLATLPIEQQILAVNGDIEIAIPPKRANGAWHKTDKPAAKLTETEAYRAITSKGIISAAEQEKRHTRRVNDRHGRFVIVMVDGIPKLIPDDGTVPDFQNQRVKLVNGKALVELYS